MSSPKLILLVGPPGSGKSTLAKHYVAEGFTYVNQDAQGKGGHWLEFMAALASRQNIVVDRMNFNKQQRDKFLNYTINTDYTTEIHVIHESYETCLTRCDQRKNHETIRTPEDAKKALDFFFKNYERVEDNEAVKVVRHYSYGDKPYAIICDLDGTLCTIDHRLHYVRQDDRRKNNWKAFSEGIKDDKLNEWCAILLQTFYGHTTASVDIILCSGRGEESRNATKEWLSRHDVSYNKLLMRRAGDYRKDSIVKEILLDFEILTRYTPYLVIDDRKQVVDMWRRRGLVCLQCAEGDF